MTDLRGKTALVTGSTSGIGKATATALAARGAHVLVVGRNEQRAKDVVAEIEGSGGSATFRLTTLSDLKSAQELVEWATEAGDSHVDILINNAGVALLGPSNAATEAEFDETFALNVKVPFFLVASLAPAMAERGWGSIVNLSTMVASFGQAGMAMYGASRAALELLTKAWAAEYGARGVRVNAVAPGPTRTPMMEAVPEEMVSQLAALAPAGRVAQPEGLTGDTAAAELICAHHTWLTRTDFTTTCIHAGCPPRRAPLRLHRLGTRRRRPRHPQPQLLALRSRHPAHRGQPRRPPHPRPPRPRPRLSRPHQHHPGHHRHHPRERLTTTTRPPPRQPGHHQAPPAPPAGPSPSPDMPTQRDADMPTERVAEQ